MSRLRRSALRLAGAGLYVFPLRPRDKRPAIEGWPDAATRDPERIAAWWAELPGANIGCACGPSGLVVLDLDGPDALAAWRRLCAEHGAVRTITAATARGHHLYYPAIPGRPQ